MQIISPSPEPRAPSPEPRGLIFDLGASTFRVRFIKVASILCGLLLLAAAGLKLYGLNYSSSAQYGRLLTPTVQSFAVVWEVLLGCWLMSGSSRFLSWLTAMATFTGFAVVSGYLGIIGQASCGCLGMIEASPWAAFGIDLGVLVLLFVARPQFSNSSLGATRLKHISAVLAGSTAILALAAVIGISQYGSVEIALARLKGEALITPVYVDFGDIAPEQEVERTIQLTNASDQTLRIFGGTADCLCIVTKDLPIELAPNEQRSIVIGLRAPKAEGMFTRKVFLLTSYGGLQGVPIRIGGRVR